MPIRLNLLAEARTAEEMRRRDPVKRAFWLGGVAIAAVLFWSTLLYTRTLVRNSELSRLETDLQSRNAAYQDVLASQKELVRVRQNLNALQQLATNRFLHAPLLQALQETTVPDVRLVRLRTELTYAFTEGTKAKTNDAKRVTASKPATATERILVVLDAKDGSSNPGDQVNYFKEGIANARFFKDMLGATNEVSLRNLSAPQVDPNNNKPCVLFTLECRAPDRTR